MYSCASGNDDCVTRLQLDVLNELLSGDDFLVVDLVRDLLSVLDAEDDDVLGVGVLTYAAGKRDQLQHVHPAGEQILPLLRHLALNEHAPALDVLDDDG